MRSISSFFSMLILCGLLGFSGTAHAQTAINEQGAAELKKQVLDTVQWRLDMTKAIGQGLSIDGDVTVTPKGSFYEVQLPKLAMQMGAGRKLDVGTVIINATPLQPGEWRTEVTFPASMPIRDAKNVETARVDIGKQRFNGTWWPAKEMFSNMDALYENIQVTLDPQSSITIGSLKSGMDLKENADSTWNGPINFEASNIKVDLQGARPAQMTVGQILSRNTYDHLDLRPALAAKAALQEAFKTGVPASEKEQLALMKKIVAAAPGSVSDMIGTFEISKFSLRDMTPNAATELSFDKILVEGKVAGTQQEKTQLLMKAALDNLQITGFSADFAGLVPTAANTEIIVDNLPLKKTFLILTETFQKSVDPTASPEAAQKAQLEASARSLDIVKALQEAATSLTVTTSAKSADLETNLHGKITGNPAALFGADGKTTISLKGMDETILKFQEKAMKPGSDAKMMGYLGGLTTVQMMGQMSKAADGKSLRNYVFELMPDGKVLLNGADLSVVLKGLSDKAQAAEPAQEAPSSPQSATPPPAPAPVVAPPPAP